MTLEWHTTTGSPLLRYDRNITAPFLEDDSLFILEHFPLSTPVYAYDFLDTVSLVVFLTFVAQGVRFIPLPVISALLLSSVFHMTNWREIHCLTKGPHFELVVWGATSVLTIFADLPIAIAVGMFIGTFLYIRKLQHPALARLVARLTLW